MPHSSYTVCEQRYDEQYDGMPRDESMMSGRIGCGGRASTRSGYFFRHDPLEEELDPCLSAAVRYQKEKGTGLLRLKYCLCCVIVLLAIALLLVALSLIFGSIGVPTVDQGGRISTVNGKSGDAGGVKPIEQRPPQTEEVVFWDILELGPPGHGHRQGQSAGNVVKYHHIVQEVHTRTGGHPPPQQPIKLPPPKPTTMSTTARPTPPPLIMLPKTRPTAPPPPRPRVTPKPKPATTPIPPTTTTTQQKQTTPTTMLTVKPTTAATLPPRRATRVHDCDHHYKLGRKSGVHRMQVDSHEFYAYCEMESGHGWTVLQRRTSDKWPFWNSTFDEYADGFGDIPDGDHWLGLESLWSLADNRPMEMRIRLRGDRCKLKACSGLGDAGNWWGDWEFTIGNRSDSYRISNLQFLRGNLSDATGEMDMFRYLCNNGRFTTVDADNDENNEANCAVIGQRGAWWHRECTYTALNGEYGEGMRSSSKPNGLFWLWRSPSGNITHTSYKIKPRETLILFRVAAQ